MTFREHVSIFGRIARMLFCCSRVYIGCIVLRSFVEAILPYVPVYFSAKLIDGLIEGRSSEVLLTYAGITVGSVFLLKMIQTYAMAVERQKCEELERSERWMLSLKTMGMAYASIEDSSVYAQRERIKKERQTGYCSWMFLSTLEMLVFSTVSIIASLAMAGSFLAIDEIPEVMRFAIIGLLLLTVVLQVWGSSKSELALMNFYESCVDANVYSDKFENYVKDYHSGKDIRIYGMEKRLLRDFMEVDGKLNSAYHQSSKKQVICTFPAVLLRELLKIFAYITLIGAAVSGTLSAGSIVKYVSCLLLLLNGVSRLALALQRTAVNNTYLKRYFSWLDIPNPMYKGSLTVEKRDDNEYDVEFRDVSFRYPNTEAYALRHVNLKFKVGQKLAVVGENGSGKTTFIKLLCRLYDPTEGEILLNGVNIQKYDYDEYMAVFSVVFQDFKLFSFSLGQNVACAEHYDADRVEACLAAAGFGQRLEEMQEGLQTCLYRDFAENGEEVSGGEAQKIALARALYKDAPFIVLDEPTAALDPVAEYEVYSRFNEIVGNKTAIYISHRLASCRFCDKIAVFDSGRIISQGSHEKLYAQTDGKYRELWDAQAQYYV